MHNNRHELSWRTPHRPARKRGTDWYWVVGTITLAIVIVSLYFGNYLFAIIAIISAFTIVLESGNARGDEEVSIVTKGIKVGKILYPVSGIHSFHLNEAASSPHLSLKLNRRFVPTVEIELGDMDVTPLREFLKKYIPEEENEERLSDVIAKSLGF